MRRSIPFSAVFNFRDLGGYPALGGRTVAWGRLYRSDTLHRLCEADREAFGALRIRTVLDLRRPSEVERDGRAPTWDGVAYRHVHPEHPEWQREWYDENAGPVRFLADRYRELAEQGDAGLAAAVGHIADADAAPIVVHCVAGKDRTGVVCALVLSLLGVSDDDIATDYALSTEAARTFTAWLQANYPALAEKTLPAYAASPPEAMLLFLAELRERHGSVERYLSTAGLAAGQGDALRAHLLA